MEREGYVGIDRNIRRHWMWPRDREFTTFEAWIDFLLRARGLPDTGTVHYQGIDHVVERGEFVTSFRQLSRDWKWDRKKVRRTVKRWVKDGSIDVRKRDRHGIHVTIVNYRTYNPIGTKEGTKNGPSVGPRRDHEITKVTKKPSPTTRREGPVENDFSWPCEVEGCGATFPMFDDYVDHVKAEHPEVFEDAEVAEEVLDEA